MIKVLMRFGVCLSGLLGIHLNLCRLVVFLDILFLIFVHAMLDLITLLFGVTHVVLLIIILLHVLSTRVMLSLIHLYLQLSAQRSSWGNLFDQLLSLMWMLHIVVHLTKTDLTLKSDSNPSKNFGFYINIFST